MMSGDANAGYTNGIDVPTTTREIESIPATGTVSDEHEVMDEFRGGGITQETTVQSQNMQQYEPRTPPPGRHNRQFRGYYFQPTQSMRIWPPELNMDRFPIVPLPTTKISPRNLGPGGVLPAACLETRVTNLKLISHLVDIAKTQNHPQLIPANIILETMKKAAHGETRLHLLIARTDKWYKGPPPWIADEWTREKEQYLESMVRMPTLREENDVTHWVNTPPFAMTAIHEWISSFPFYDDPEIPGIPNQGMETELRLSALKGMLTIAEMIDMSNPRTGLRMILEVMNEGLMTKIEGVQARKPEIRRIENDELKSRELLIARMVYTEFTFEELDWIRKWMRSRR